MFQTRSGQLNQHKDNIQVSKDILTNQSPISYSLSVPGSQINKPHSYPEYNIWMNNVYENLFGSAWDPDSGSDFSMSTDVSDISSFSAPASGSASAATSCCTTPCYTPCYTPISSQDLSLESIDSDDSDAIDLINKLRRQKRLNVAPSCFTHGCVCGHNIEFRDMAYETRKRRIVRSSGVTIKPKIEPISVGLKQYKQ